jgi:hypothetical protein
LSWLTRNMAREDFVLATLLHTRLGDWFVKATLGQRGRTIDN